MKCFSGTTLTALLLCCIAPLPAQLPIGQVTMDQLIGINGPSGPPCVTTNKPIKERT